MALFAANVVIGGTLQHRIKARVEGRLGRFILFFGRSDIRFGRAQDRAVGNHLAACVVQAGRQCACNTGGSFKLVGLFADNAQEVGVGVRQVGLFGDQVVLRLSQSGFSLIHVRHSSDATAGAQFDLVKNTFMAFQVVFCQLHHLATGQDIQINLSNRQCGALGGIEQRVAAGIGSGLLATDFIDGAKTLEQILLQANGRLAAVQGLPVMAVAGGTGGRVIGFFTTVAAQHVEFRQVAALGFSDLVVGGNARINSSLNLWVIGYRVLHGFRQCLGLDETGG